MNSANPTQRTTHRHLRAAVAGFASLALLLSGSLLARAEDEPPAVKLWQAPTIDKSVTATYTAEYRWAVRKSANGHDDVHVTIPEGEPYLIDYAIAVTLLGRVTSNFVLKGEIGLGNPKR